MRLARISLDKFGHFNGVTLELPARMPDLHILAGDNEAGKSTTEAALADLLFGFEHNTRFAYLHDTRDLRIGARIESGGRHLDIWRRKVKAKSLVGADGEALEDAVLGDLLSHIDRDTFTGQFSLDHKRLRAGGEAFLDAGSDLGRLLFQAGAGLDGLGGRLTGLDEESAQLFKERGSTQTLAKALKQRETALKLIRDKAASERTFKEAREEAQRAREALGAQTAKRIENAARRDRLERARRAIPLLRKIDALRQELARLDAVPSVSADFRTVFDQSVAAHEQARHRCQIAADEVAAAKAALHDVGIDEDVLSREGEIDELLGELRSRYLTAEADLPKRLADLRLQESVIASQGREVGQPALMAQTVAGLLPDRQKVSALRRLAGEQVRHDEAAAKAGEHLRTIRKDLEAACQAVAGLGCPPDPAPLRAAIDAVSVDPELAARIAQAESRAAMLRIDIAKRLARMVPAVPETAQRNQLPSAATIDQYADDFGAADKHIGEQGDELRQLRRTLAELSRECETLLAGGRAVPAEHLAAARGRREQGWQLLRQRFIDGKVPDLAAEAAYAAGAALPEAYAAAVADADDVADSRFDAAETSGKLMAKMADVQARTARLAELEKAIDRDRSAREEMTARWQSLWTPIGIAAELPAAMSAWAAGLEAIEENRIELQSAEQRLAAEREIALQHQAALLVALAGLGVPQPDANEDLFSLLKRATDARANLEDQIRERSIALRRVNDLRTAETDALEALTTAQVAQADWASRWQERMAQWSLPAATEPLDIDVLLDAWETIRSAHVNIDGEQGLRHRIATMQEDQQRFTQRLGSVVEAIAADLRGLPPQQVAQRLDARLKAARSAHDRSLALQKALAQRVAFHARAEEDERRAEDGLRRVLDAIGVQSVPAANPVLGLIDARNKAIYDLAQVKLDLDVAGSGLSEAEIRLACEGIAFDALGGQIAALEDENQIIVSDVERLGQSLGARTRELDDFMQASAAAANAAEEAAQAATVAIHAAERYIRLQTTAVLLRHAIDRYRRENEAPLLGRASGLFRELTLSRYERLEIDHDSAASPKLLARQTGGGAVPVNSLSDGTRDQLFLSLRIAAIEDLIGKGTVVPFVADDLFINFDDDRAAAGLKVLAGLATRTQVLFFTHHQHLLDLASKHIPQQFNTLRLTRA